MRFNRHERRLQYFTSENFKLKNGFLDLFSTRHKVSYLQIQQVINFLQHIYLMVIPKITFIYAKWSLGAHKFGIRYQEN